LIEVRVETRTGFVLIVTPIRTSDNDPESTGEYAIMVNGAANGL